MRPFERSRSGKKRLNHVCNGVPAVPRSDFVKKSGNVTCRVARLDDVADIHRLIAAVFEKYIADDYSARGVKNFLGYIKPSAIITRLDRPEYFSLVARQNGRIVGIIEIRNCDHICLLFVDADLHRRGIARILIHSALKRCISQGTGPSRITVNSSPYAVYIYRKLGFVEKGPSQEKDGIIFVPMVLFPAV